MSLPEADRVSVYIFRSSGFAPTGDTVVTAAPKEAVVKTYGGGGHHDTDGLATVYGGAAVFGIDPKTHVHVGVWGSRKAARFRSDLKRAGINFDLVRTPPPGRLLWFRKT
jgi:hypothetical protein